MIALALGWVWGVPGVLATDADGPVPIAAGVPLRSVAWRRQVVPCTEVVLFTRLDPDPRWAAIGRRLVASLTERGVQFVSGAGADLERVTIMLAHDVDWPPAATPEAYRINVSYRRITLTASTPIGLARATTTALRLFDAATDRRVRKCTIEDWPAHHQRGVIVGSLDTPARTLAQRVRSLRPWQINRVGLRLSGADSAWPLPLRVWCASAVLCAEAEAAGMAVVLFPANAVASSDWIETPWLSADVPAAVQKFATTMWIGSGAD